MKRRPADAKKRQMPAVKSLDYALAEIKEKGEKSLKGRIVGGRGINVGVHARRPQPNTTERKE